MKTKHYIYWFILIIVISSSLYIISKENNRNIKTNIHCNNVNDGMKDLEMRALNSNDFNNFVDTINKNHSNQTIVTLQSTENQWIHHGIFYDDIPWQYTNGWEYGYDDDINIDVDFTLANGKTQSITLLIDKDLVEPIDGLDGTIASKATLSSEVNILTYLLTQCNAENKQINQYYLVVVEPISHSIGVVYKN